MSDAILEIKDVSRTYKDESSTVTALNAVNLSVKKGEFVSIIGSSGCGKTTLLRLIAGFDKVQTGEILMKGNTSYGIGMVTTRITNAILGDENAILTISSYDSENDLFIGYPTIVNQKGAIKRLKFPLSNDEEKKYQYSINTLKEVIKSLK